MYSIENNLELVYAKSSVVRCTKLKR